MVVFRKKIENSHWDCETSEIEGWDITSMCTVSYWTTVVGELTAKMLAHPVCYNSSLTYTVCLANCHPAS